jgi:hypothetical protein
MPRQANQSGNWDFKVVPVRLYLPPEFGGGPSNMFATSREDTHHVFGEISEKGYGLVQNSDFVGTVRTALESLGMTDYREELITLDNGAKLFATYNFDNRVKTLNKVGDTVGLVLRFANSFDGTTACRGELMAKILRCLNGMCLNEGDFSLLQRHTSKINLDFVKQVIDRAVNRFDEGLAVFDVLAERSVSDEQGVNFIDHMPLSEKVRDGIKGIWINPNFAVSRARTLYALYDAATEYLRDVETSRFAHANKLNRQILRLITRALDPANFAEYVKPVPKADQPQEIQPTDSAGDVTPDDVDGSGGQPS